MDAGRFASPAYPSARRPSQELGSPKLPLPAVLVMLLQAMKPKVGRVFDDTDLRTEWAKACTAVAR
jgi:hypothetical protein